MATTIHYGDVLETNAINDQFPKNGYRFKVYIHLDRQELTAFYSQPYSTYEEAKNKQQLFVNTLGDLIDKAQS